MERKPLKKPRIGLYTIGLAAYWPQFPGLRERLLEYGSFIESKITAMNAEVYNYGMVDTEQSGLAAGEYFNRCNVDLIFCHSATYCTSACVLPVHLACKAPVVLLNLQPTARINYAKSTTGEWLALSGGCPVPEVINALHRAGIGHHVVNGLLGLDYTPAISLTDENTAHRPEAIRAWRDIRQWVDAASVRRNLLGARFGFLGNTYGGMLDMYSDFTMMSAQMGIHLQVLEMCDLDRHLETVTEEETAAKRKEIEDFFIISDDDSADPLAHKPADSELNWSAEIAVALDKLVEEFDLDALAYYYHGAPDNHYEQVQAGMIVGHSLLTAAGIPCAGEGDLKTALAMKICDLLGIGGSFCEIIVVDYEDETIHLGHDGPFHLAIAKGKPILRGLDLYHGKQGAGISVEAKVKTGPITNLNCTQTVDGRLKFITAEAMSTDGEIMTIGNTETPVRFTKHPDAFMDEWFSHAPTHHFAMSVGHNADLFQKVFAILNAEVVQIGR